MVKEKVRKPKCNGIWRRVENRSGLHYECTKCGHRLNAQDGANAVDHKDKK